MHRLILAMGLGGVVGYCEPHGGDILNRRETEITERDILVISATEGKGPET